ncbi:MAG: sulfotransferase family 2 domain-containing protein, partial [Hyphomicrobium sp.]
ANPKAGTSSIQHSLKQAQARAYDQAGRHYTRSTDPHVGDDCLRHDGSLPGSCNPRFVVSCVRNPFTRSLSAYLDKVRTPGARPYSEFRNKRVRNFEDHLRALQDCNPKLLNPHFRPQHFNLDYPRIAYDAIFYLENPEAIERFVSRICGTFKMERYAPHSRGAAELLLAHYNERALRLVRELYARDFELFGYGQALENACAAPGDMIAGTRLLPCGMGPVPRSPRQSTPSTALKRALRIRRLVDRHLL